MKELLAIYIPSYFGEGIVEITKKNNGWLLSKNNILYDEETETEVKFLEKSVFIPLK